MHGTAIHVNLLLLVHYFSHNFVVKNHTCEVELFDHVHLIFRNFLIYLQIFQHEVVLTILHCEYQGHPYVNWKIFQHWSALPDYIKYICTVLFLYSLFIYASKYIFSQTTTVKPQSEIRESLVNVRIFRCSFRVM